MDTATGARVLSGLSVVAINAGIGAMLKALTNGVDAAIHKRQPTSTSATKLTLGALVGGVAGATALVLADGNALDALYFLGAGTASAALLGAVLGVGYKLAKDQQLQEEAKDLPEEDINTYVTELLYAGAAQALVTAESAMIGVVLRPVFTCVLWQLPITGALYGKQVWLGMNDLPVAVIANGGASAVATAVQCVILTKPLSITVVAVATSMLTGAAGGLVESRLFPKGVGDVYVYRYGVGQRLAYPALGMKRSFLP